MARGKKMTDSIFAFTGEADWNRLIAKSIIVSCTDHLLKILYDI